MFAFFLEQTKSRSDNAVETLGVEHSLPAVGPLIFVFEVTIFHCFSEHPLLKMDTSNTDDLLDYLKLDPDHHEKIASLIPQVTLDLEVWQQLSIGK